MNRFSLILIFASSFFFSACDLEKEIEIELPPYERLLNVECYILPNNPFYALFLTETVGYYDEFNLPVIEDALVTIRYAGVTDTLKFTTPVLNGDTLFPIPIYFGFRSVIQDYVDSTFTLVVQEPGGGRRVTAQAKMLPVIRHNAVEWEFNDQGKAYVLTRFNDPGDQENYYRRVLERRYYKIREDENGGEPDTSLVTEVLQDFSIDDKLLNGQEFVFGTDFSFERGDTVISSIYHIEKSYNDFLTTSDGAIVASFSPFAQPSRVLSNIEGGTGIFTALALDQVIREIQ